MATVNDNTQCAACSENFCFNHFVEHRQKLSAQLDRRTQQLRHSREEDDLTEKVVQQTEIPLINKIQVQSAGRCTLFE